MSVRTQMYMYLLLYIISVMWCAHVSVASGRFNTSWGSRKISQRQDRYENSMYQDLTGTRMRVLESPHSIRYSDSLRAEESNMPITQMRRKRSFQGPKAIEIPQNMTLAETFVFWDNLICSTHTFCESANDTNRSGECTPYWCISCVCDNCDKHKDCCVDSYLVNATNDKVSHMTCRPGSLNVPEKLKRAEKWYYFVDSCPDSYDPESTISQNCKKKEGIHTPSELDLRIPMYSSTSQLNYVNRFCAQCHGDDQNLTMWHTQAKCSFVVDFSTIKSQADFNNLLFDDERCYWSFNPPQNIESFECQSSEEEIRHCNVSGNWLVYDEYLEKGCEIYRHRVYIDYDSYRNVFCAMCNGVEMSEIAELVSGGFICAGPPQWDNNKLVPFSVLFNFHESSTQTMGSGDDEIMECSDDQVYDPNKGTCRKLICSEGMMTSNHTCIDIIQSANGIGYKVHYHLFPGPVSVKVLPPFLSIIWDFYVNHLYIETSPVSSNLSPMYMAAEGEICYESFPRDEEEFNFAEVPVDYLDVELLVVVGTNISPEEAYRVLMNLIVNHLPWPHVEALWLPQEARLNDVEDRRVNKTCLKFRSPLEQKPEQEMGNFPLEYMSNKSLYIEVGKLSRCNKIKLETDEYSIDTDSQELTLSWSNKTLGKSDYVEINNSIHICVNFSGWYEIENEVNSTISKKYDDLELWFTVICLPLSLAGLVITFLVCICSRTRQTIPGKITLVVVVTVFTAQLLFLVSGYVVGSLWPCRLLGLAIHFFWLSVFAWKNVAAYHMYAVFINPFRHTNENKTRTLLLYSLYGFGIPVVIVVTYTVTRTLLSASEQIGYGDAVCFLSRPLDVGLALGLPVGIVLVSNTYFFARAVHAIRQMSEIEKNSNRSNSSHTSLYIKMSLVLGFTWIVGFLANIINHQYLWYAFILLNGGTGIFICLSQTCNKHVISCLPGTARAAFGLTSESRTDRQRTTSLSLSSEINKKI